MATLLAAFRPDTASVLLTIDGASWSTVPATVTATRQSAGGSSVLVRGVIGKTLIGGYLVATDHEMDLNSMVTYTVTGYSTAGAVVGTASATVSTPETTPGIWVKAAGRPDLTVWCKPASLGEVGSPTVGGVYQVIGGGSVAVAQFGGVAATTAQLVLRTDAGAQTARLRALMDTSRILLLQTVGVEDLDDGWYLAGSANRSNPGGFDGFGFRYTSLSLTAVRLPGGQQGGAVWTYASVKGRYATYAAAKAGYASYWAMAQGPGA